MRASPLVLGLIAALAATGCPQRVTTLPGTPDAAVGGADAGRGPSVDGGAPVDAGASDAGVAPDGGRPPEGFDWAQIALPNTNQTPLVVWGEGPDTVYIGTTVGFLFRITPAGIEQVWRTPTNFGLRRIWGVADRLFAVDEFNLYVFDRQDPSTTLQQLSTGSGIGGMHGLAPDRVWVASERMSERSLFAYDGQDIRRVVDNFVTASLNAVWVDPGANGGAEVRVAGNGRIILYDGLTFADEPTDWPAGWSVNDIANFFVRDLVRVDDGHLGVGSGGGVLWRGASGRWAFEREPADDREFRAVTRLPGVPGGAVAVGDGVGGHPIWFRTAAGWAPDAYAEGVTLLDVWAPDANTVYAVGFRRGGGGEGVALVGRRR